MTVRDYSATANDNTTIAGISLNNTMLADALDNAIRAAMADTANFLLDIAKPTSTTGSTNAYLLTTGGTVSAYADKVRLAIRASFSNTGSCTINVDGVGVVDLKIYTSSGVANPASGQIQSGGVYDILYVDALSDFVVLNPTPTSAGLSNIVEDTTPQLGGTLDTNSKAVFWSKGADVASATELLVLTDGNSFDVTGTTPITSIEESANAFGIGSVIMLQFDGILTLTHSAANLILPSAANITTAAGDIALFQKYATGDWRCISYSKASGEAVISSSGGLQSIQKITATGTWTRPAGITKVMVYVTGGGGGGAGIDTNTDQGSTGGAAGGTSIKFIDVSAISSSTVTIGASGGGGDADSNGTAGSAGGTSSWADGSNTLTSTGGGGGTHGSTSLQNPAGGVGSGGDINTRGGPPAPQDSASGTLGSSHQGGASFWGDGGLAEFSDSAPGGAGLSPGSGGGSADDTTTGGTGAADGGAGAAGLIYVMEYA